MKKVFAVLFVAASIVMTSCGGAKETSGADSTATSTVVDSAATKVADSTATVTDSTATVVDSAKATK